MIKVEHLTKYYQDFKAIDDISFEIEEGHVYGFLGTNGAGKSTTMNIMTGCLSATDGVVTIDGRDIFEEPIEAKKKIGYLPEQPPLYLNETPKEYLRFIAEAKGVKKDELEEQIQKVMEQTGINKVKNKLISNLSKGYKQRVGIAQALLGNPKVIILDEPTVGLDPIQIIEIRDLIKDLGKTHTIILSSHILSEVQAVCEKVLIISHGKLVAFDTLDKLETEFTGSNGIYIKVLGEKEQVESVLETFEEISEWSCAQEEDYLSVLVKTNQKDIRSVCCALSFALAKESIPVFEMISKKATLENIFIELTEEGKSES